jgi:NADPH-dependent ferric siderophore reductase
MSIGNTSGPIATMAPQGRRMGRQWSLRVVSTMDVTAQMRRVRLAGDDLDKLEFRPGQEIVLAIPQPGDEPARRHYTIRQFDRAAKQMDVDFVLHGHGVAGRWAQTAKPGDRIEAMGPRGRVTVNLAADWHLFSGDEAAFPAIFAMLESLPATAKAFVFLEAGSEADQQAFTSPAKVTVKYLYRGGVPAGQCRALIDEVAAFTPPPSLGHAYLIGETSVVRAQRQGLIAAGFPREQISAEGYWRPGRVGGHDHVDDRSF